MKIKSCLIVEILILLFAANLIYAQKLQSVYTDLDDKHCRTLESNPDEAGWYRGLCPGVGGYKLELTEGDLRQSITVVSPAKKRFELDFNRVSPAFSYTGQKAEWRVQGKNPVALIVRFNASTSSEHPEKEISYLIVSKITRNQACITDVVAPSANQNAEARRLADIASTKPCKAFD